MAGEDFLVEDTPFFFAVKDQKGEYFIDSVDKKLQFNYPLNNN